MRHVPLLIVASALVLTMAAPAAAQRRSSERTEPVPNAGMIGLTFATGVTMPAESITASGPSLVAGVESYVTRRVSIRGQLSGSWLDVTGPGFSGTSRPLAFNGNVVYNWEGGRWHPFATGGIGVYQYRFTENSRATSDGKFGMDVGGGVEFFLNRRDSVRGEVLFNGLKGRAESHFASYDPRFWTVTVGYKTYWR